MTPKRRGSRFRQMFSAMLRSGTTFTSCGTRATPAREASSVLAGRYGCPAELQLARIAAGGMGAGQDLDQRRLSRAVRAEQRHDLARRDREADIDERPHAGKRLGQTGDADDGLLA